MFEIAGFYMPCDPWLKYGKKRNARWKNSRDFQNWFVYLTNLYLNNFEWNGFPDSVNTRFLEETLYYEGKALFFDDKTMGMMALPCSGEDGLNVYWEYNNYRAISNNYSETYTADESTLIRENQLMYPPIFMIENWASKISDGGRTIDVYAKTLKKPWLITCEDEDKVTQRSLVDEIDDNELVIVGAKRLGDGMKAYGNSQDGNGLMSLWRHKHESLDECLTFMGINNANTDKRERLITSEVESNNQLIQLNTDTALDWRKRACEEINKKFGLNVTCELKHDYIKESEDKTNGEKDNDDKVNSGKPNTDI